MPPPPPPLVDDLIGEILLRLPPDDPACLVRASVVCKPWRRLLTDRGFLRRYRAFHRTPPVLALLHSEYCNRRRFFPSFVPTAPASPISQSSPAGRAIDCRHGRVLLQASSLSKLAVWNPITGDEQEVIPPEDLEEPITAAVLCASDGCDHLDCHGGPFLVVLVGMNSEEEEEDDDDDDDDGSDGGGATVTWVSVYSSETDDCTASVSIHLDSFFDERDWPSLLAGDAIYFLLEEGKRILKYDLKGDAISVIDAPPLPDQNFVLATAEDGGLGLAAVEGYSLHLWSCRTGPGGDVEWTQGRVIELDTMISIAIGEPSTSLRVVGFEEGARSIFVSANDGIFAVELKSGRVRKICKRVDLDNVLLLAFTRFYTPDHSTARLESDLDMQNFLDWPLQ